MKLHNNIPIFRELIKIASHNLPVPIKEEFVEKDYWITLALNRLSKTKYAGHTVFKGGTSLWKGFGLINRFSEDVDIAIINNDKKSGNEIKTIIRTVEKEMTKEMKELHVEGVTSKGSRFRKSVFEYPGIDEKNESNKVIVEVNSFANSVPHQPLIIKSLIYDFLSQSQTGNEKYIEQYELQPFTQNVLNKEQTLLEKLVSLIRFSFDENAAASVSQKIRYFYDLYYLTNEDECSKFIGSEDFKNKFDEILKQDRELFDEPKGWKEKPVSESPLVSDFDSVWQKVKAKYKTELSALAFAEIPDEKAVAASFKKLISRVK